MVIKFYSAVLHLYQRFDSKKALADTQEIFEDLQRENERLGITLQKCIIIPSSMHMLFSNYLKNATHNPQMNI